MSQVGEKLKLMEPEALDFRFIQQVSGQWSSVLGSSVLGSSVLGDGTQEPERAKEQAEFNLFQSRLAKEVAMFSDYTWQLQLFHARQNEEKVAANLYLEQALAAATDTFSNHWMPCRRTSEAGVLPYVDEVMVSFAVSEGISSCEALRLHIACFGKLGVHWFANAQPTVSIIANAVSAAPENVAAIVFAPNVGKPGDAYDMLKIQESEDELDAMLREDTYTTFEPPAASFNFLKNRLDVANLRGQVEPLFGLWFPRSGMQKASSFQNGMVASSRRESVHKDFLKRYHYLNKDPLHDPSQPWTGTSAAAAAAGTG